MLPTERGKNLDSKAILTKDEQRALVLYKNTKNTNIGQMYKWNQDKWGEKLVRQMDRHKAKLQPHFPVFLFLWTFLNGHQKSVSFFYARQS